MARTLHGRATTQPPEAFYGLQLSPFVWLRRRIAPTRASPSARKSIGWAECLLLRLLATPCGFALELLPPTLRLVAVSWRVSLDPSRFLLALFSALSPTRSLCCASALFRFFLTSAFAAALLSLARLPGTSPCDCRSFLRLQPCGCVRFPDAAFACRLRSAFRNRFRIALRLRHSNFACARLELWWPIALSRDRLAGCR
jgi:hypothetical protein